MKQFIYCRIPLQVEGSYFARFWGPGCKGVEAFDQRWDRGLESSVRHLAYINGPFDRMGEILKQVKEQQVDCVMLVPSWPRPWAALLAKLPVRARERVYRPDMFVPGGMVPQAQRLKGPKAPRYAVWVYYILW